VGDRLTKRTAALVQRRWREFCKAVVQAQKEHGRRVQCYFGEGQVVADRARLEEHHEGALCADDWNQGGCVLIELPDVDGFYQDGGGW